MRGCFSRGADERERRLAKVEVLLEAAGEIFFMGGECSLASRGLAWERGRGWQRAEVLFGRVS